MTSEKLRVLFGGKPDDKSRSIEDVLSSDVKRDLDNAKMEAADDLDDLDPEEEDDDDFDDEEEEDDDVEE